MTLHGTDSECHRAVGIAVRFADGDLAADELAWLNGHIKRCTGCADALRWFAEVESALRELGQGISRDHPVSADAKGRLAARIGSDVAVRRAAYPALAAAVVIAVALVILLKVQFHRELIAVRSERPFVAVPYLDPPDPRENTEVVRMNIPVETLLAMGYWTSEEPDAIVPVDLLVGEDGRAHAVRPLSDIELVLTCVN